MFPLKLWLCFIFFIWGYLMEELIVIINVIVEGDRIT